MDTITNSKSEVEQLILLTLSALTRAEYVGDVMSLNVRKASVPEVGIVICDFRGPKMIYTSAIFNRENGLVFK